MNLKTIPAIKKWEDSYLLDKLNRINDTIHALKKEHLSYSRIEYIKNDRFFNWLISSVTHKTWKQDNNNVINEIVLSVNCQLLENDDLQFNGDISFGNGIVVYQIPKSLIIKVKPILNLSELQKTCDHFFKHAILYMLSSIDFICFKSNSNNKLPQQSTFSNAENIANYSKHLLKELQVNTALQENISSLLEVNENKTAIEILCDCLHEDKTDLYKIQFIQLAILCAYLNIENTYINALVYNVENTE